MKRVCTVTYFNVDMNYGQTLQAYALQAVLRNMGYDTVLLNYWSPLGQYRFKKPFFLNRYADAGAGAITKQLKFDKFIHNHIRLTDICFHSKEISEVLDKNEITHLVCGSDQIWNPEGMDAVYFLEYGNRNESRRKIAYAASMCSEEVFYKYRTKHPALKTLIEKVDDVSMREETGAKLVEGLIGRPVETVLDPTLLVPAKHWRRIAKKPHIKGEYVLCFFYGNGRAYEEKVKQIAARKGNSRIVSINTGPLSYCAKDWKELKNLGPDEFIGLIDNAAAVCTDSFHGTAFSINLNKDIYCFARSESKSGGRTAVSNGSRITGIMKILGIENRYITPDMPLNELQEPDYRTVNQRLALERKRSREFLRNALEAE